MNPRTRNIIVIIILLLIIVGGGIGVYFVTRQVTTSVGLVDTASGTGIDLFSALPPPAGDNNIDWMGRCTVTQNGSPFDAADPANWNKPVGGRLDLTYTCENLLPDENHQLQIDRY